MTEQQREWLRRVFSSGLLSACRPMRAYLTEVWVRMKQLGRGLAVRAFDIRRQRAADWRRSHDPPFRSGAPVTLERGK